VKALSLKQPWAQLIVEGKKTIELRSWNTHFRGRFLIHASKNTDKQACARFGFEHVYEGCVIGSAVLCAVKEYKTLTELRADQDKHWATDRYTRVPVRGFVLRDAKKTKPVKLAGALGFFNTPLP